MSFGEFNDRLIARLHRQNQQMKIYSEVILMNRTANNDITEIGDRSEFKIREPRELYDFNAMQAFLNGKKLKRQEHTSHDAQLQRQRRIAREAERKVKERFRKAGRL